MTIVGCYFCGCPVEWDPAGKLEAMGITLEHCERHNLAVICNLCLDMAEVEDGVTVEVETIDHNQLKAMLEKDAA